MVKCTTVLYFVVASFPWSCWILIKFPLETARAAGYQTVPRCLRIDLGANLYLGVEILSTMFICYIFFPHRKMVNFSSCLQKDFFFFFFTIFIFQPVLPVVTSVTARISRLVFESRSFCPKFKDKLQVLTETAWPYDSLFPVISVK